MAKVSVIIPCFDAERFIVGTLDSALEQTRSADEIIVVDDGSTDGSWDVIRSFGDRVKAVRQPNLGASAARNRGTSMASGEFIQYLDADDLLAPGAIERKLTAAEANGADLVYSDWQKLEPDGRGGFEPTTVVARAIEDVNPDVELAAFTDFWCPPAALLYRRTLVDRIGGWHADLPIIQDARFLQDAVMSGARLARVPEVLAFYRQHSAGSLSRRSALLFKRDVLVNAFEIEDRWRRRGTLTKDRRSVLSRCYREGARFVFWDNASLFSDAVSRAGNLRAGDSPGWEAVAFDLMTLVGAGISKRLLGIARHVWRFSKGRKG